MLKTLRPLPSVVKGVQACRLPGLKCVKTLRGSFGQALRPLPSVVKGNQACRLPGLKPLKRFAAASTRHSGDSHLLWVAFKPAVCQAAFSFASYFLRALFAGTCQCFFWHRFPAGVSCVTAIRPRDCDDHTTVEQTGQLCAWRRVSLLTAPSFTWNWLPHTDRWLMHPVLTLLFTLPLQNGHR